MWNSLLAFDINIPVYQIVLKTLMTIENYPSYGKLPNRFRNLALANVLQLINKQK